MTALFKPLEVTRTPIVPSITVTIGGDKETPTPFTPTFTPSSTPVISASVQPSSPTLTLSPTPLPTESYKGPGMRSGESIAAEYLENPPKINGDLGDWGVNIYQVPYVVFGSSNWEDKNDLSATIVIGWDEVNLYVGVRVKDDKYVQKSHGSQIYLGDSIEILIDTDVASDYYLTSLNHDDYQLGISPGNPAKGKNLVAYLWYPRSFEREISQVEVGVLGTERGYHIECAIPWKIFGISPYNNQHFGFVFSVSDNDDSSKAIQQTMISNVNTRRLTDPSTWGDLTLTE
jgi:hypothetical protein